MRLLTLDDLAAYFRTHVRLAQLQIDRRYRERVEAALSAIASGHPQAGVTVRLDTVTLKPGQPVVHTSSLSASFQRLLRADIQEVSLEFEMLLENDLLKERDTWTKQLLYRLRPAHYERKRQKHVISIHWSTRSAPMGVLSVDGVIIRSFDMDSGKANADV